MTDAMPNMRIMLILVFLLGMCLLCPYPAGGVETGRSRIPLNGEWEFEPLILDKDPAVEKGIEVLREKYSQEDIERYLPEIIRGEVRAESLPKDAQKHVRRAYHVYREALERQLKSFSTNPPPSLKQKITVPSFWTYTRDFGYPEEWRHCQAAWYGTSFHVPDYMRDLSITLRFEAVNCLAKVFVNGRYAGGHIGGFTPFEIDITDLVETSSPNTLRVFVQDGSAVMTREGQYTAPVGEIHHDPGIWQDVSLNAYPRVHIRRVAVKTSVRRHVLRVEASIMSRFERPVRGSLKADVANGISLGEKSFLVQPMGESRVIFEEKWENPVLWSPEHPHLYQLTVRLYIPASREASITDQVTQSFGFREFWIEGNHFFLNGTRIRLRGDSINRIPGAYVLTPEYVGAFFQAARGAHINTVRIHTAVFPQFVLDMADKAGMLIINEAPIMGWTPYDLRDLTHFREFFQEWVERDRNHPSVIIWSALNECLSYKRGVAALEEMIRSADDTRPVKFEGNGDAYGAADIFDVHYPGEDNLPRLLIALLKKQRDGKLDRLSYDDQVWSGNKPITAGEFSPIFYASPDQIAFLGGDAVYEGLFSGRKNYDAAVGEFTSLQIATMRNLSFAHIAPWSTLNYGLEWLKLDLPLPRAEVSDRNLPGMHPGRITGHYSLTLNPGFLPKEPLFRKTALYERIEETLRPLVLFVGKPNRNAFENEAIGDTWTLHNDTTGDIEGTLVWRVLLGDRITDEKCEPLTVLSGHSARGTIEARLPKIDGKETIRVEVTARDGRGESLVTRSCAYTVYPKRLLTDPIDSLSAMKIGIVDKTGETSRILRTLGATPHNVLNPVDSELDLLIIGKDSLDNATADAARAYSRNGGKVLILEQGSPSGVHRITQGKLRLEAMEAPIAFSLADGHPALEDVGREGLRFWGGDYLVSRLNFLKPTGGMFRSLAEVGGKEGLRHTPLVEMREGKGVVIMSQLVLVEKFNDEPMAALLLRNILSYVGGLKTDRLVENELLIIHDRENRPFMDLARGIGLPFKRCMSSEPIGDHVRTPILIIADAVDWSSLGKNRGRLLDYLERGGILMVQGLTPDTAPRFNGVFGTDVRVAPTSLLHPQVEKGVPDEALWGISNHDLVWSQIPVRCVTHAKNGKALIREPARTAEFPHGLRWGDALRFTQGTAREIAHPGGALLKIPHGRGAILINQILPVVSEPKSKLYFRGLIANQLLRKENPVEN